jgi:hypothetical protein
MNRSTELKEMKNALTDIVERHERLKNSYFFHPSGNASGRRNAERRNNQKYENVNYGIVAKNVYSESCAHVYYKGVFFVAGKKVTVREIKKIINALDSVC